MKRTLYILSDGILKRKAQTLYLETKKEKKYFPVENIQEIFVLGEVTINKKLLEFLTQKKIILHFFNYYGYYVGSFYPREHLNSGYMILKQAEAYLNPEKRLFLARKFVEGAVENIKKVLIYYQNRGKPLEEVLERVEKLADGLSKCEDVNELMAIEGNIREQYYKGFDVILDDEHFIFEERSRRPPLNRLNALISFANSMLYTVCLSEIYYTHLDPRIGFLHTTNFRSFSLNLDVAEIFKPVIADRTIFTLVNKKMLKAKHFEKRLKGIVLNDEGKKVFIEAFEERLRSTFYHKKLRRKVSYRRLIRLELYKLEKHLIGEEEYKPFVAYW